MKVLPRDEVSGLHGKQGYMLGSPRGKHPNKQHWPARKVSEGQEPKVLMAKDIEHEGTQRKCSGLWAEEKAHSIVFQFLSLFLTVLLDYANKKKNNKKTTTPSSYSFSLFT